MQEQVADENIEKGKKIAMHVCQAAFKMFPCGIGINPFLLSRCKIPQINKEKAVKHKSPHGKEADCDVIFSVYHDAS